MNIKKINHIIIRCLIPLFAGTLIYLVLRSSGYNDNIIHKYLDLDKSNFPDWVKFNLSDALWIFSFYSIIFIIFNYNFRGINLIWFTLPLLLSFLLEFGQLLGKIAGTFDILDLIFYVFGFAANLLLNFNRLKLSVR